MSRPLFLVFATLYFSQCSAAPETEAAAVSADSACSANSAPDEAMDRRSCEPEDSCILCNANLDDCKNHSTLDRLGDCNVSQALLENISLQVRARVRKRIAAGKKAQILYIGPNDFSWEDVFFFKRVHGDILHEASITLVEPLKAVHEQMRQRAKRVDFHSVDILQAGVSASKGDARFLWYEPHCFRRILSSASPALEIGEEMIQEALQHVGHWTGMDKLRVTYSLTHLPFIERLKSKMKYSTETWDQGLALQLNSECVQEFAVPIYDPPSLMKAAGFSFDQLDVLIVDTEGFDHDILKAFLAQPDFDPAYIMFEWAGYMNDGGGGRTGISNLMRQLSQRGFDVHHDKQDMQVVRSLGKLMDSAPHAATS